jgi:hypothetical protein
VNEQGRAQPGWYPDPSGPPGQRRWWDGTRWREHTQPAGGGAPPTPPPGAAPPGQPARSGTSSALVIVLVALFVVAVLGFGGCVACAVLVGEGAEDIGQEFEREFQREFDERAITRAEFESVERGMRLETVRRRLGPTAETTTIGDETCLYYNRKGGELGDQYEFCSVDGRLRSKSAD